MTESTEIEEFYYHHCLLRKIVLSTDIYSIVKNYTSYLLILYVLLLDNTLLRY